MDRNSPRIVGLPFPVSMGEEIRVRRYQYTRLSSSQFARKAEVPIPWYKKLEEGNDSWRPDEEKLRRVEEALGLENGYILHRIGQFTSEEVLLLSELVSHYRQDFISWLKELHQRKGRTCSVTLDRTFLP